ncbi:hypothetical protein [Candidatus Neptunichlamydia sp. REUL1]|uniref:hypothetical protein n=1 Tax=Candidatus Neptunichlamydia sp. REUL1 TaxID=3064277 RepID=UPI002931AACE|nr:hypothetical protein [Candidatus Neptunochlamydia sp. REUL1]
MATIALGNYQCNISRGELAITWSQSQESIERVPIEEVIDIEGTLTFPNGQNSDEQIKKFCIRSIEHFGNPGQNNLSIEVSKKILSCFKKLCIERLDAMTLRELENWKKDFEVLDHNNANIKQLSDIIATKLAESRRNNKSCFEIFCEKTYSSFDMTKMSGSIAITAATTTAGTIHGLYLDNKDNQNIGSSILQSCLGACVGVAISAALNGVYSCFEKCKQE